MHSAGTSNDSDSATVDLSKNSDFGFIIVIYEKCFSILKYLREMKQICVKTNIVEKSIKIG